MCVMLHITFMHMYLNTMQYMHNHVHARHVSQHTRSGTSTHIYKYKYTWYLTETCVLCTEPGAYTTPHHHVMSHVYIHAYSHTSTMHTNTHKMRVSQWRWSADYWLDRTLIFEHLSSIWRAANKESSDIRTQIKHWVRSGVSPESQCTRHIMAIH